MIEDEDFRIEVKPDWTTVDLEVAGFDRAGDNRMTAVAILWPDQARKLATLLNEAADRADQEDHDE